MKKYTLALKKPKSKLKSGSLLDYHQCQEFIDKKYNIDSDDYNGLFGPNGHFEEYQKLTGDLALFGGDYPNVTGPTGYTVIRDGRRVSSTKEEYDADFKLIHAQYQRYQGWTESNPEPEYSNFWHWVLDRYEPHNGSRLTFYKSTLDEMLKENESTKVGLRTPEFVKIIYGYFIKEFANKNGKVEMRCEW